MERFAALDLDAPRNLDDLRALYIDLFEAGLPQGVLNLVHGPGGEVGEYLATHPGVNGVSFTGSSAVGMRLAAMCSQAGKEFSLEMGGKNAIIVMEDADLDLAVEVAIWGGFGTAGQRCTAASRLVVHKDVYGEFLDRLAAATKRLKLGNGLLPDTDVGPLVSDEQLKKVQHYVQVGMSEIGGERRQKHLHVRTRPIPFRQSVDGERVSQVMKSRLTRTRVTAANSRKHAQAAEVGV